MIITGREQFSKLVLLNEVRSLNFLSENYFHKIWKFNYNSSHARNVLP